MRRTRASYHYAVKHVIKNDTAIRSSKMAQAISGNCDRMLWKEVKFIKKIKQCVSESY